MSEKSFKKYYYVILTILILLFYTKDIDLKDGDSYEKKQEIKQPDILLVLVNKKFYLPEKYEPNDLEMIWVDYANEGKYLRKEAKEAFEKLSKTAKQQGYRIVAISAYRSYDYQQNLYQEYVATMGNDYAENCSARPGHSEHQTGLAVDVEGSNQDYDEFEKAKEFEWMKENAHHFGFILRYPEGKTKITGFKYEPWHYRYVGTEIATIIYQENITLEEYYDKYINLN